MAERCCLWCKAVLVRGDGEFPYLWARRKYCGRVCAGKKSGTGNRRVGTVAGVRVGKLTEIVERVKARRLRGVDTGACEMSDKEIK